MKFKGLFIGIDHYASPLISDLSCAVQDAKALYGLFADTLGSDGAALLTDSGANRAGILRGIASLNAGPDDVVIISFSGHGSDSHHLITHDADPLLLDTTAIHLDDLTALFASIKARNVLLLLDCCFAGGAGARVFHAPIASRAASSAEAALNSIAGAGRLIFTAAAADQEAIEDRRRGHGLFSFHLLEGLRGAPELISGGLIGVLPLVAFVTRSVIASASQIRHKQEPALRGTVEGDFRFPPLVPGTIFGTFFPDAVPPNVTSNLEDLRSHGFNSEIVAALAKAIPGLNQLQQDAINKSGLFSGQHLVVSAPTSSGKTLIGELAALHHQARGERTYMLLPLRALVNDKHAEFTGKYSAFGLRVIRSTGEISDDNDALLRSKFDIALLTYERFAALAVVAPHILRQVGLIVIDEVQMITDLNRGANLEFLLTLLKAQRLVGIEPQLIALSAVIGDTNGFEAWLDARLLKSEERPVPLDEGLLSLGGDFRFVSAQDATEHRTDRYVAPEYRKGSSQDVIIPLVRQLVALGEKVIVFRETKPIVRSTAEYLKVGLGLPPSKQTLERLPGADPSVASAQLRGCLNQGVAFHNADLDAGERQAIEVTFRDPASDLKVLVATTTLAMGVNTPASSVVIAGLDHPGAAPYSVAEYKNMVGRAGRLGFSETGKSFLVAPTPAEEYRLWRQYVLGKPEDLVSRFSDQEPLSLICRVLATATASRISGMSGQELADFIKSSFGAHQRGAGLTDVAIGNTLARLESAGLVEKVEDRFRLTELGKVAGELGVQVESVVRVGRALRGLSGASITGRVLLAAAQVTMELDEINFPIHRKSVQERQRWRSAVAGQGLPGGLMRELSSADDAAYTARCKRLAAVTMWLDGTELRRIEESVLRHLPGENAAGPIRSSAERTRDLIGVVARVAGLIALDGGKLGADADVLSLRLELGIPGEVVWLAQELRRGFDRGDYLALVREGLASPDSLAAADPSVLQGMFPDPTKRSRLQTALERIAARNETSLSEEGAMPSQSGDV